MSTSWNGYALIEQAVIIFYHPQGSVLDWIIMMNQVHLGRRLAAIIGPLYIHSPLSLHV